MSQVRSYPDLLALRPRRVCLIKPSALGDIANTFFALGALRAHWPKARIAWVVNSSLRGLVEAHPQVDEVIPFDRRRMGWGVRGAWEFPRFLQGLAGGGFDVAIDLQGLLRSGLMAAATRAPVRVGLADAREGATWFYTHRIVPRGTIDEAHAIDRLLSVVEAFGADSSRALPQVACRDADRFWARAALQEVGRPRLAINLGARWETKRWPPESFAAVARAAVETRGAGLFAVGAPEDRPFVRVLAERLAPIPVLDLCGQTTLPQLAALAQEADVVLSNDTGPLHLAVAAGARVVGVYTCTRPEMNGPYSPSALVARSEVACAGSYLVRCPYRLECMHELTPERVIPLVLRQLDAAGSQGEPNCTAA